jgi:hypothetical protein
MEWSGVIHRFLESPCPTLRHSGAAAEPMGQVTRAQQDKLIQEDASAHKWSKPGKVHTRRSRSWLEPARLRRGARKMPLELARLCQAARNCSAWLLENTAPADVSEVEPARIGWGARHWRLSPLGSPGPETLHWAGPRMLVALNTETNMLRAWYAWVRTSIYIFIYNIWAVVNGNSQCHLFAIVSFSECSQCGQC